MKDKEQNIGKIISVNGPIVQIKGFKKAKMRDMCLVGEYKIPGEIIRLFRVKSSYNEEIAIVQVFEDTSGLVIGDEALCLDKPLSMELGPGLLGKMFDGIQRPLEKYYEHAGGFITRGLSFPALDRKKYWEFLPKRKIGERVQAGDVIGTVDETSSIEHRIIVPPNISGKLIEIAPKDQYRVTDVIYKIQDANNNVHSLKLYHDWPITTPRPFKTRLLPTIPLISGVRLIDCLFPLTKGGCAAIPGGFGTGKTVMQHQFAKFCDANIIVFIGCGERGNEMADIMEEFPTLKDAEGKPLMDRTILIGNTSNMPVSAREASIFSGITIAEYFRDQGYHVALMADSTSRWAEALREISGRLEELPAEGGYPAYLGKKLAFFYERAGYVEILGSQKKKSSISIIGAVSPPGGDFSDPVVQATKRFIKTFWALDPRLAYSRQYPAINWIDSYSLYIRDVKQWWVENIDEEWNKFHDKMIQILHEDFELQDLVQLLGADALPLQQQLTIFTADLIKKTFLLQNAFDDIDMFCTPEKQAKMLRLFIEYYDNAFELLNHGAPLFRLKEMDVISQMARVRKDIKNENYEKMDEILEDMRNEFNMIKKEIL
ncbi:MAG: V-type ATP synthase subunit A [Promethearchaeota archaeon]